MPAGKPREGHHRCLGVGYGTAPTFEGECSDRHRRAEAEQPSQLGGPQQLPLPERPRVHPDDGRDGLLADGEAPETRHRGGQEERNGRPIERPPTDGERHRHGRQRRNVRHERRGQQTETGPAHQHEDTGRGAPAPADRAQDVEGGPERDDREDADIGVLNQDRAARLPQRDEQADQRHRVPVEQVDAAGTREDLGSSAEAPTVVVRYGQAAGPRRDEKGEGDADRRRDPEEDQRRALPAAARHTRIRLRVLVRDGDSIDPPKLEHASPSHEARLRHHRASVAPCWEKRRSSGL